MLNNYVNFDFSIMEWDLGHEKMINIIGRHGILDIFMDVSHSLENDHLCSKSAQKR